MIELSTEQRAILKEFIANNISKTILTRSKSVVNRIKEIKFGKGGQILAHIQGSSSENYEVEIQIEGNNKVHSICSCFYYLENFDTCKHIGAVMLECTKRSAVDMAAAAKTAAYIKLLKDGIVKPASSLVPKEELPLIGMEYKMNILPDYWSVHSFTDSDKALRIYNAYQDYTVVMSDGGKRFEMVPKKGDTKTFIQKIDKRSCFVVGCNCKFFKALKPCYHIVGLMIKLYSSKGKYYFNHFEDFTAEKNRLLVPYGITTADELANGFKFGFDYNGNIVLATKPTGVLPIYSDLNAEWKSIIDRLPVKNVKTINDLANEIIQPVSTDKPTDPFDTAILFNLNQNAINGFRLDSFKITQKGEKYTYTNNKLKTKVDLAIFNNAPSAMQHALFNIVEENLVRMIREHSNAYNISDAQPYRNLDPKQEELINVEYTNMLQEIAPFLASWKHLYYLPNGSNFSKNNVKPCRFVNTPLDYKIVLKQTDKTISLIVEMKVVETGELVEDFTTHKYLLLHKEVFYFIPEGINKVKKYLPEGKLIVPVAAKNQFINKIVLPLATKFPIDMGDVIKTETIEPFPEPRVYLSELNEKYLIITPKWLYEDYELDNDGEEVSTLELGDKLLNITRNPIEENKLVENLRTLHPSFSSQNNEHFYLHFDEVMKKNWFLTMYQQLQEMDIPVFGFSNLKKFKYNTNKPVMDFKAGSGVDWFDIRMDVSYGDQVVPLATLRKAIINKQQFVLLSDGTLGMLPDEWIKKFASLMKMGSVKNDSMQVSKLHWTIIDQLHEQENNEETYKEILAKKERLKDINNVKKLKLPSNIKATLRDYQKSGFQWMSLLDEMGWGGCLADDMGLGKTLQTLTFLSAMQLKHKGETHLIVCPTSLIYNWQTEIDKFAPHLTYYIHYGTERELNEHDLLNADIVITSYGLLRSDIEQLVQYQFGYIILDESQAIKNHLSQTAKAAQLIKARNRLILSGTPVQNNTFDLYAQFNFINPGLLGNMEFFKTEFSNPIDRDNNKEKTEQLRKLIYPFMLRRTKEQVAKDLPEKTETILWCEMEGKQRTIYNSFRDDYRKNIMEKIEKEGFAKAGIFILSGLTKLRQICDSPAILNETEAYPNVSVKIDELMREIEENASNHKALVFSQFTSMLGLIGTELTKRKVAYYYLDGSTKAADRLKAVADFQANDAVKIFLISLKAGGVGLNLTAADYVYMVDPWWNPATEQQAIDRTHRIGQQKSVFSYKLICKDSIEEKILKLQQKKKSLSADLISDENGFVKKLTKDDVAYLFS